MSALRQLSGGGRHAWGARRLRLLGLAGLTSIGLALGGCAQDEGGAAPLADIAGPTTAPAAPNGIDGRSPMAALRASRDALTKACSYQVSGQVRGASIDLDFDESTGATGTVTADTEFRLIAKDDRVYVSGDQEFFAEVVGAEADETVADRWRLMPPRPGLGYHAFTDGQRFVESVFDGAEPAGFSDVHQVEGKPAVGLEFPEIGATLWIAAEGEPLPLRFEEPGAAGGHGVLSFSEFGEQVGITLPDEDDVVDVSEVVEEANELTEKDVDEQLDEEFEQWEPGEPTPTPEQEG